MHKLTTYWFCLISRHFFPPEARGWVQEAIVPLDAETHAGTDVAVYAQGPSAYLFTGVHEQNYIAHAVRYAACLDSTTPSACNP